MTETAAEPVIDPEDSTDRAEPETPAEPETFDQEYVQKLRDEAAGQPVKVKRKPHPAARRPTSNVGQGARP